jgi:hypothetical protein
VPRLASLLWWLRRATTIESGVFEIEAEPLNGATRNLQVSPDSREVVRALFGYEATLWRQAGQVLFTLDALDRHKPQERRFRFRW